MKYRCEDDTGTIVAHSDDWDEIRSTALRLSRKNRDKVFVIYQAMANVEYCNPCHAAKCHLMDPVPSRTR